MIVQEIMLKFSRLLGIIFCGLTLLVSGCNDKQNTADDKKRLLIMGTSADYPPFEFLKDQEIKGFDIDLAEVITKKLGYELQVIDISFPGLVPSLQTGRIDFAISGFTFTPGREQEVDFSTTYYSPSYSLLFRKENPIANMDKLDGRIIGVQLGTSMEMLLKSKQKNDNFQIVSMTRTLPMVQDLKLQRIDGILLEEAQAKVFVNKDKGLNYYSFSDKDYGYTIVFAKDSQLRDQFNEVLLEMRDSGELDELKKKWLF